jgi:hypothetical protein
MNEYKEDLLIIEDFTLLYEHYVHVNDETVAPPPGVWQRRGRPSIKP